MVEKQLNYRLVLGVLAVLLVLCTTVHFVHAYQMGRHSRTLRAEAEQAENTGQLDKTVTLLQRYLTFTPGDTDALEHLGRLLERQARTTTARWRVVTAYEQVLDQEPKRADLRRRVVDLLMGLDAPNDAIRHLEILQSAMPDDGELENLLGQCQEALGEYDQAAATYEKAIVHAPTRVAAHVHLAALFRYRLEKPSRADEVMDALVRTNSNSAEAWLEHGLYRLGVGLAEPAGLDLERARDLAPDDPRVLVASAELFYRLGKDGEARQSWQRGLEKYPRDLTMYLGLATLEMQTDQPADAVALLNKGLELDKDNPDLLHLLTEAYLQQDQPDEARKVVARLDADTEPPGLTVYLTGRILQHEAQWDEAIHKLDKAARDPDAADALTSRAWLALGNCYERLGDADRQVSAYQRAIAVEPTLVPARYGLGSALLAVGKVEEALEQYRQVALLPRPPDAVWVLLARTLLQRNLSLPPNKRNWEEIDRYLDRAAKEPTQAIAAALLRADTLVARDDLNGAWTALDAARTCQPKEVALWTALATLARRRGDLAGAEQILADAQKELGDRPELLLAEVDFHGGREGPEVERLLQDAEKRGAAFSPQAQTRVLTRVAEAYYEVGRPRDGDRLCRQLAGRKPLDLQTAVALLDLVLLSGDEGFQDAFIAQLKEREDDGTWWRYGKAACDVLRARRGNRSGLAEARALLTEIEARRPTWARVAMLGALLDDLDNEPGRALDGYLRAFELGERQPAMVRQLVQRLAEASRFADADQVVRKLHHQQVLRGGFARLAAEVALRARQFERAALLARQGFPADSHDYHRSLWLGQMLDACGQADEAEEAFRRAVALADDMPDTWAALVAHLANADRIPAAEAAITAMQSKVAPDRLEVALGVCYEALSRWDTAEKHYQTARREQPRDALAMQRLASYYLRLNHSARAEPVLRDLIDPDNPVPQESVAWARRQLALILAPSGNEVHYGEALDLMDRNRRDGAFTRADQRALDLVKATRPEARRVALRVLEETLTANPLTVDEERFVARLYEAEDDWPRARDHLLNVMSLDPKNPEYLAYYVGALLSRGKKDEARSWLMKLEKMEPDSERVKKFRVEIGRPTDGP